jgi:hypothetical protein
MGPVTEDVKSITKPRKLNHMAGHPSFHEYALPGFRSALPAGRKVIILQQYST